MPTLRTRNAALLVKIESTPGTFDAPNTTTDGILIERPRIGYGPQLVQTDEVTGSLDSEAPIVGGMQATLQFPFYLKGGVLPGVAPEWGKLARICGLAEVATVQTISGTGIAVADNNTITDSGNQFGPLTVGTHIFVGGFSNAANANKELIVTVSAAGSIDVTNPDGSAANLAAESAGATITIRYGVAGTLATAGTTISATLQAPFAATAQLYRGMPVLLSGNPATPEFVVCNDYTVGRLLTITKLMGAALTTSTRASIPANVRYQPVSTGIPAGSVEVYMDGLRRRFRGCRGMLSLQMDAGGAWRGNVTLRGLAVDPPKADAAMVTPTYDATRPGIWRASRFAIDRIANGLESSGIEVGSRVEFPADPNDPEGFTVPEITQRQVTGTANPYETLVATRNLLATLRSGSNVLIDGQIKGNAAANAGGRLAFTIPTAILTNADPDDARGFSVEQLNWFCRGADSGFQLAIW
ncbi:MAG TPA: hypothetical protein VJ890_28185 [Vineibacter sp.]|nr:hypothetical protein [Vineibacter sp.]